MTAARAFVALGSNAPDAARRLAAAMDALARAGERIASCARTTRSPFESARGEVARDAAPVLNSVIGLQTTRTPRSLLDLLHDVEAGQQRDRRDPTHRSLDLDLLTCGDACGTADGVVLPHPRATRRGFVLAPWEEIAPLYRVPGTEATVTEHAARLRARHPDRFQRLAWADRPPLPDLEGAAEVLATCDDLAAWREAQSGPVGVVPTMGALHAGHESLFRRAGAECSVVVGTLFVNPLQFAPGEDLDRYPQTFDADCALLRRAGAAAVYAPAPEDLYPPDYATFLSPEGPARGYEGAERETHFRGVATVVYKLWRRTRPDRAYFGQKDAQQLAVIRRMVADLELAGQIVACPTVRERDGLALSSRNRYLSPAEREQARALPRALEAMMFAAAAGDPSPREEGRDVLEIAGLEVDYLDIVDPDVMTPVEVGSEPALAVAAVRVGATRLLDNRWLVAGARRRPGVDDRRSTTRGSQ